MLPVLLPEDALITRTPRPLTLTNQVLDARLMSAMFGPNHLLLQQLITTRMLQTACLCIFIENVATKTNTHRPLLTPAERTVQLFETDPWSQTEKHIYNQIP